MKIIPIPKDTAFSDKCVEVKKTVTDIDNSLEKEEYILKVCENGTINISAGSESGIFYAKQTIKQLEKEYGSSLPVCIIRDKPDFEYRAFMLDCARHMFPIDEIKKLIDAMAFLKLNKFHWHLTDDQGWRIESEKYPKLNTVAAVRKHSDFGKIFEEGPYGRVYTKNELTQIVSYCKERFIEVIPEFDIPGHTSALLAAFPELACGNKEVEVKTHQGIFKDVICPAKEESIDTVLKIFDEICEIFPSEYIHIGGDETPSKQWESCPECQALMHKLGIKDYHEYQNFFMNKVIAHLAEKGKTCIVWNDAAKGKNLDSRAVMHYWKENDKATLDFANNGGKLILSPFSYYYTDYDYDITPLNRTVSFNPMLKGLNSKESILGLEVPIWTEYISDNERLEKMLFPRAIAVAQTAWGGNVDYHHFLMKFNSCKDILEEMGIQLGDVWLWKNKRTAMPVGWLKFLKRNYSSDYIKSQLK